MSRVPLLPGAARPVVFAHRGCSSLAPENTMAAFRRARELGADGLEMDIHRCASGELVVIHDDNLSRTAGLDKPVEEATLDEIRSLDAGSWFGEAFRGEKIPTLDEVLDEFGGKLVLDVEIKSRKAKGDPLPSLLARELRRRGLERTVAISSFNPVSLAAFKAEAREYATAVIWCASGGVPFYLRSGQGRWISGCDFLKPIHSKAGPRMVGYYGRFEGRPVVPWTVDDPALAKLLVDGGCAGIITNRPQDILPALGKAVRP